MAGPLPEKFAPIPVPEIDLDGITWAMCRNPMCKNFGLPYEDNAKDESAKRRKPSKYRFDRSNGRVTCRHCKQSFVPKSNEAIRPILRYFLSLSVPFAACSKPECVNYGRNFFVSYTGKGGFYRRHSRPHSAVCRKCRSSVTLGEKLAVHVDKDTRTIIKLILFAFLLGAKKRRTVHFTGMFFLRIITSTYYRHLRRIGSRLRSYHSWRNARLLDPRAPVDFSRTARVYTDVAFATLRHKGDIHRYRNIPVIVSILALEKTYYLLAAHPYFLPHRFGPDPDEPYIDPKTGLPSEEYAHRWACIEHRVHDQYKRGQTPEQMMAARADMSRIADGFYIQDPYAEIAHFLVVQSMLRRFKRVCFYMDAAQGTIQSAMVGLAEGIRSRRTDVVLVQRQYHRGNQQLQEGPGFNMGIIGSEERRKALHKCWKDTEAEVQRVFATGEIPGSPRKAEEKSSKKRPSKPRKTPAERFPDPQQRAAFVFKRTPSSGFKEASAWAWLHFPAPLGAREKECRSLWLTRMPGKTFEDGEEALLFSTLQPVDSAIAAIRSRVRAIDRPANRAAQGRSFTRRYYDPLMLLAELSIYSYARNFLLLADDQELIPAEVLGLKAGHPGFASLIDVVMGFRLDRPHAKRLTRWRLR